MIVRALLLGAGGRLGGALVDAAPPNVAVIARERAALDVTDPAALARALETERPDLVLNAAAYAAVDRAESEPAAAHAVNADAVARLGRRAAGAHVRVLHVSTDYVFDGAGGAPYSEDATPAPLSVYGRTKLAGERALLASGAPALVVRTQWLFAPAPSSFPARMLARARAGLPTRVVSDQRGRPTAAADLAPALWRLALGPVTGVLHVAGAGEATWHDVARLVFGHARRPELLTACTTAAFPTPARRPPDSRLDTARADRLLGAPLPPWEDSLRRCLAELDRRAD